MDAHTVIREVPLAVPAWKMFMASVVDAEKLPMLVPELIKDVRLFGDGGPGSIQHVTICIAGSQITKEVKNRIDAIDREHLTYNCTVIEGDSVPEKFKSISQEITFEPITEMSCKGKHVIKYHPQPGVLIKDEDFMAVQVEGLAMIKDVEAHLVANLQANA